MRSHLLAAAPFLGVVEAHQRAAMLQDVMTDQTRKPAPLTPLKVQSGPKIIGIY